MEEIQITSNIKNNNNINKEKLSYSQKLLFELLKTYPYEEVMNYIFDEEKKIDNDNLQIKLKELLFNK